MAKLLRLDVAQLTDVGRKREHNEDNMAYVIPKDGLVMARKGALFIVADGMGGHAAGEVASEIAVDTVSNTYYQDDNDDVPTSLLYSIRRANAAIHQRAAENMLRSGMGTTCVAAILRGNTAYIANVGDSRAYLVRGSRIRQISQDHSWVAEQVRAGLLTEEQARTHAQRNVITRSLGTQTEVEIDIFREILEEGDTLLLCSDGLTGCVHDEELQRSLGQLVPQESVYHLIERANENGGGDNITAVVARVQELGVEPPNMRQPVPVGGPELSEEDTARLFAPANASVNINSRNGEIPVPGSPFPYNSSGPLTPAEPDRALKRASRTKRRHNRLFYPTLVLLLLLVLGGAGTGVYYFLHANQAKVINQTLTDANLLITQAESQVTHNPQQALQNLSSAQTKLKDLQQNYTLDTAANTTLTNLEAQLVSATRIAVTNYNLTAKVTLLPCTTTSKPDNLSSGVRAQTVAVIKNANNSETPIYMLAQDGKIYQFNGQSTLSNPFQLDQNTQFISIVGAGDKIFALSKQQTSYAVVVLTPGAQNTLSVAQKLTIDVANGLIPTLITSWSNFAYVAFSASTTPNTTTIVDYTFDVGKNTLTAAPPTTIAVTAGVVAITAFPDQILFLLLADGEVLSTQIKDGSVVNSASPVVTSTLLMFPLTNETPTFTSQDSVPTAPQAQGAPKSTNPLKLQNAADVPTMSAGAVAEDKTNHLFIAEPAYHRVLDLEILPSGSGPGTTSSASINATTGNNVTLSLVQQYVSPTDFNTIKSVALDPTGVVNILGQNTSNIENLVVVTAGGNQACAS